MTITEVPVRRAGLAPNRPFKRSLPKRRAKLPKPRRKPYTGKWTLKECDTHFSGEIKKRDGKCQFPGCEATERLTCSHYIGRATKSTRLDPDNCVMLCLRHHWLNKELGFEFQKQTVEKHGYDGQYTLFMKKRLGTERYVALIERSKMQIKQPQAIADYQSRVSLLT